MQLLATDKTRLSHLVKHDYEPTTGYTKEVVTYNGAAKTFNIGDLVTSVGGVPGAAANIFGVVMAEVAAPATTDTKVLVMARGPAILSKAGINLGALVAADVYTRLDALGIEVADAA